MGQILIVSGGASATARALYDYAIRLFQTLHGGRASHEHCDGAVSVARFQRLHGNGAGLVVDADAGTWGTATGVWFHQASAPGRRDLGALTEALLAGGAALDRVAPAMDGYFVLAAGRSSAGELAVMTDRDGALHVYRAAVEGCVLVSTSALVLAVLAGSDLDREAAREFLATGSVFEERSLFEKVEKLEAARVYRFRDGSLVSQYRWFRVEELFYDVRPRGDVPELAEALAEALRAVLAVYPRPLFDLTGGYDTRNILATALRLGIRPRTLVAGPASHPDVVAANRMARELGLDHRHYVPGQDYPWPSFTDLERAIQLSDGECNVLDYAPVAVLQAHTARDSDVNINGSFGELCRGYWWDPLLPWLGARDRFDSRKFARRRFVADTWADQMTRGRFANTLEDHFAGVIARANRHLAGYPNTAYADNAYFSLRMQRWGGRIASATLRIRPCASPFFFLKAMGAALSAPPARRLGGRMAQNLVEHLSPELAALPMAGGYPALPVRPGTLHRFAPLGVELLGRAGGRLLRKAGRRFATEAGEPKAVPPWVVWSLPEIPDLLHPETLLTRDLYDDSSLDVLLEAARSGRQVPALNMGFILTLELAAQTLRAGRLVPGPRE